jgi:hypothetical protein
MNLRSPHEIGGSAARSGHQDVGGKVMKCEQVGDDSINVADDVSTTYERRLRWQAITATLIVAAAFAGGHIGSLEAQQWRGRAHTRVQYVQARTLVWDSVAVDQTTGDGSLRLSGTTQVRCAPAADYCYFSRAGQTRVTSPVTQDVDLNVWGFGVQGLRLYGNARFRGAISGEDFWPRADDHVDLLAGYLELQRSRFRIRVGRDYQVSGLGYYGYDGGSALLRLRPARLELEAYGGIGLERGLADRVDSDALSSLDEFQPRNSNFLFGVRASARPIAGASVEAIYQREEERGAGELASERVGVEATYSPKAGIWLQGHADYDLATDWWGKAGGTVGWSVNPQVFVEGRVFRYRPVFSLQTIWAVFSPTPYTGFGVSVGLRPMDDLSVSLQGERRDYGETDAGVPFEVTTDRTWRAGGSASWQPEDRWRVDGGYWLNFSFGSATSTGQFRVSAQPMDKLSVAGRFSAFQQIGEFRVGEGRVWSVGAEAQWDTPVGTLWGSIDRYRHDRRENEDVLPDWTQTRASFGMSFYLGTEPGRTP